MLYLPHLLALAGVWSIVVISPGPDFIAIVHHAISRSRRDGLLVVLGVATGLTIWAIVSIVGLASLFARFSWLAQITRMVGICYLTYMGINTIWNTHWNTPKVEPEITIPEHASAWRTGLLTDLSNPKAAVFFSSLFAVFLPTHASLWLQIASVGIIVMIAVCWYGTVAYVFSLGPVARLYTHLKKWVDSITGGILVALGVHLALS